MSLDAAIQEAYAEPDIDDDILDTLELDHSTFAQPIYIIANQDENMTLGGQVHTAVGVRIMLLGFDDDGPTQGNITIDNISAIIRPYLEQAVLAGEPITVTYRGYLASDPINAHEVRGGLFLSKVQLNATSATGVIQGIAKYDTQAFPRLIFSQDLYPALHGV